MTDSKATPVQLYYRFVDAQTMPFDVRRRIRAQLETINRIQGVSVKYKVGEGRYTAFEDVNKDIITTMASPSGCLLRITIDGDALAIKRKVIMEQVKFLNSFPNLKLDQQAAPKSRINRTPKTPGTSVQDGQNARPKQKTGPKPSELIVSSTDDDGEILLLQYVDFNPAAVRKVIQLLQQGKSLTLHFPSTHIVAQKSGPVMLSRKSLGFGNQGLAMTIYQQDRTGKPKEVQDGELDKTCDARLVITASPGSIFDVTRSRKFITGLLARHGTYLIAPSRGEPFDYFPKKEKPAPPSTEGKWWLR